MGPIEQLLWGDPGAGLCPHPACGAHAGSQGWWAPEAERDSGCSPGGLPVCIFGNRARIKLKEDDAHESQGGAWLHGSRALQEKETC